MSSFDGRNWEFYKVSRVELCSAFIKDLLGSNFWDAKDKLWIDHESFLVTKLVTIFGTNKFTKIT